MSYPLCLNTNMKSEGSGNVTGLKFENRTRTQSRIRSPILKSLISTARTVYLSKAQKVSQPSRAIIFCHVTRKFGELTLVKRALFQNEESYRAKGFDETRTTE